MTTATEDKPELGEQTAADVKIGGYYVFTPPKDSAIHTAMGGYLGRRPWFGDKSPHELTATMLDGQVIRINPKSITIQSVVEGDRSYGRTYKVAKDALATRDVTDLMRKEAPGKFKPLTMAQIRDKGKPTAPRKPLPEKGKVETYHIINQKWDQEKGKGYHEYEEVKGRRITVPGYEDFYLFAHGRPGNWRITCAKTGFYIGASGSTLTGAVEQAKDKLDSIGGPEAFQGHIDGAVKQYGYAPSYAKPEPKAPPTPKPTEPKAAVKVPPGFTVTHSDADGTPTVMEAPDGEIVDRIGAGPKKGQWQTMVGGDEFVAETPEKAHKMAAARRAEEPFKGKEGWQIPRKDWMRAHLSGRKVPWPEGVSDPATGRIGRVADPHWAMVDQAAREGKPVPEEVLEHYPKLKALVRPESDIEVGDFIQLKGEIGKGLRAPRGFVEGEGTVGKDIPAWKIRQADDSITLIPKAEAVAVGKPPKPPKEMPKLAKPEMPKPTPTPKPETTMPRDEALRLIERVQSGRTRQARATDKAFKAQRVLPVEQAHKWAKAPHRYDIKGVDTPCARERPLIPGIAYADKGAKRMARKPRKGWKKVKFT